MGNGLATFGPIGGYTCSSTRAGIVGVMNAMLIPEAIHIGCDNKAVVDKLTELKQIAIDRETSMHPCHLVRKSPLYTPWGLQQDGDLWEVV